MPPALVDELRFLQDAETISSHTDSRKKLADIDDTDDEPGTEDWGPSRGNHQEGMTGELTILIARAGRDSIGIRAVF